MIKWRQRPYRGVFLRGESGLRDSRGMVLDGNRDVTYAKRHSLYEILLADISI